MRIENIETFVVGATWKNWVFARVHTDEGIYGVGEGTLNGFARTIEQAIGELSHLVVGQDPRDVTRIRNKLLTDVSNDGGHIHRHAVAAIEVACWDILGKSLDVPIHRLFGGRVRDSVLGYANGWYRTERTPEAFVDAAREAVGLGFRALKLDPFGTAQGFIDEAELRLAEAILEALRDEFGDDLALLIDVHARFTDAEAVRVAERLAPIGLFWWEEPTTRDREEPTNRVAARSPVRVATGETFHLTGQFFTLASQGGVSIWQPEPMSLAGLGQTMDVASLARTAGAWIAPHQSGGPLATVVCLQLAACVPNFLIQEHFDPFNDPWTADLVTWRPAIDPETGHLSLPDGPGLGADLDVDVAREHPYNPDAFLNVHEEGWERRIGRAEAP